MRAGYHNARLQVQLVAFVAVLAIKGTMPFVTSRQTDVRGAAAFRGNQRDEVRVVLDHCYPSGEWGKARPGAHVTRPLGLGISACLIEERGAAHYAGDERWVVLGNYPFHRASSGVTSSVEVYTVYTRIETLRATSLQALV